MSPRRWPLPLLALLALGLARATAADPDPAAADEQTLRAADLPTDGPGLLDVLRKRTLPDADRLRALGYIRQFGDANFDVRERASAGLRVMGSAVRPLLREALIDPDPEVVFRAQALPGRRQAAGPTVGRPVGRRPGAGPAESAGDRRGPFEEFNDL